MRTPHAPSGVAGAIAVPPSKSLTQRVLLAAALAGAGSRVEGPLEAEDPRLLYDALRAVGFDLAWADGSIVAADLHKVGCAELTMGNNGTGARFLLAQLAALPGEWLLDGSPRLRERPVGPLVAALRQLGAGIEPYGEGGDDRLPLVVRGRELTGGVVELDAALSSQFVSALMLLGPRLARGIEIALPEAPPSRPYLDLTAEVLEDFGAEVEIDTGGRRFRVAGSLRPRSTKIEADWSAAAFPLCAAAVAGGRVEVTGVRRSSRQGDAVVLALLEGAGCRAETTPAGVALEGPATRPLMADLRDAPDLFPPLAVVVARAGGRLTGLAALTLKESDRLTVMSERLAHLGFAVRRGSDWFEAEGLLPRCVPDEVSDPADDHRIAMALAVAGCAVAGVRVADPGCVAKSWPGFWEAWSRLAGAD